MSTQTRTYPQAPWAVGQIVRGDRLDKCVEDICVHGVGHPNREWAANQPEHATVHGCDGCCDEGAMLRRNETQQTICQWAEQTFGPTNLRTSYMRYAEEARELDDVVQNVLDMSLYTPPDTLADECADVFIMLCQVAQVAGFDLQEAVNKKMAVNRARKWRITGEGVGQHVED